MTDKEKIKQLEARVAKLTAELFGVRGELEDLAGKLSDLRLMMTPVDQALGEDWDSNYEF